MDYALTICFLVILLEIRQTFQQVCVDSSDRCPQFKDYCGQQTISDHCQKTCTPACSASCSNLPLVNNGTNLPSGTTHNSDVVVTYLCNAGFVMTSGNNTNKCVDGNWTSNVAPVCEQVCSSPPAFPGFTLVQPAPGPYLSQHELVYKCANPGASINVVQQVICQSNYQWSTLNATCFIAAGSCGSPPSLNNGIFQPVQTTYAPGSKVTYQCGENFALHEFGQETCTNGSWTKALRVCVSECKDKADCSFFKQLYCSDTRYVNLANDECRRSCKNCPTCTSVPLTQNLTTMSPGPYYQGDTVEYMCSEGFIDGPYQTNVCIANETWLFTGNELPQCRAALSYVGIVIDETGSMGSEINAFKALLDYCMGNNSGCGVMPTGGFTVSLYSDPGTGPVIANLSIGQAFTEINNIIPSGGGDCPELAFQGIINALETVPNNTDGCLIYMFTDASAKDGNLLNHTSNLMTQKGCHFIPLITGSCCGQCPSVCNALPEPYCTSGVTDLRSFLGSGTFNPFYSLAQMTNGRIFLFDDNSALGSNLQTELTLGFCPTNQIAGPLPNGYTSQEHCELLGACWHKTLGKCFCSSKTKPCPSQTITTCTAGVTYSHQVDLDCQKFLQCLNGVLTLESCSGSDVFDTASGNCTAPNMAAIPCGTATP